MELKLTVDAAHLGSTVEDAFKALSHDEKKALAREVMLGFLQEPHATERAVKEASVVQEFLNNPTEIYVNYSRMLSSQATDKQIRSSSEFTARMKDWRSTREIMLAEITKTAVDTFREEVTKMVREDPKLNEVLTVTLEEVRKSFPSYVHDAIVAWFSNHMTQLGNGISSALCTAGNADGMVQRIAATLSSRGLPI